MGVSEINTWVLIRRYDKLAENDTAKLESNLHELNLTTGIFSDDLRAMLFRLIDGEDDGSRVLKIRRQDNNLIPLSTLLNGSAKDKPFLIDVVGIHQFCPVEKRTVLPGYIEALRVKLDSLEQRVLLAEKTVPTLTEARLQAVEDATSKLANCVSFLDRRLDELAPPDWRTRVCSGI
ncbi:uncharacterized protein [Venturia canescens]|uniref:uncharacterized protein n=1 Tax=Venturia canescens TaxID=32260 RepID=UPI001C9C05D9|nr:uncharacterized protein LOC122408577 [Venturia canescens]